VEALEKIDFRKERTFGELFNATSMFVRMEWKRMLLPLIIAMIPTVFIRLIFLGVVNAYLGYNAYYTVIFSSMYYEFLSFYSIIFITCVVYAYLFWYFNKEGKVKNSEVIIKFLRMLVPAISFTALMFLAVLVGIGLLLLPGIYLLVCFQVVFAIKVLEEKSWMESIKKSLTINRGNWIKSFLYSFLIFIIILLSHFISHHSLMFISYIFNIYTNEFLISILFGLKSFLISLIYVYPAIFFAFYYFDIKERKYKTNLMKDIDDLDGAVEVA
jgi:hypothetical protein